MNWRRGYWWRLPFWGFFLHVPRLCMAREARGALPPRGEVPLAKPKTDCRRLSLFCMHAEMIADEFASCRVTLEQIYRFCDKFKTIFRDSEETLMNRHRSWTVILDCSCFVIDFFFFLNYQYGTGSGVEYKIMLSLEGGGSSSRNWTGPMGKPKMRKEGLNPWWISDQSSRVFPLIAGRMFSFMKTRLGLSDTDNLSTGIFVLCVLYVCTQQGFCCLLIL